MKLKIINHEILYSYKFIELQQYIVDRIYIAKSYVQEAWLWI